MFISRLSSAILLVGLLTIVSVGHAVGEEPPEASSSEAVELTLQAEERFLEGRHDEALQLLHRAYDLGANPNILFNIALVHEERGDAERAVEFYDRFVAAGDVDPDNRATAERRAAGLRQELAASREPDPNPEESTTAAEGSSRPVVRHRTVVRDRSSRWRIVGLGLAGAGVATLATGGVFGLLSLRARSEAEEATDVDEARSSESRRRTLAGVADGLFVSGGVLTITGIVIALASPPADRTAGLSFSVGPNAAGVAWSARF